MDEKNDQVKIIQEAFHLMKSKDDLLNLLNIAKKSLYGKNYIPFELKQLTYYSNPNINPYRYSEFYIRKKNGSARIINSPKSGLKALQKTLCLVLSLILKPTKDSYGFTNGKSIYDNALVHVGSNYVFNIDLKDFFSSIDQARVWKCFQNKPFNLTKARGKLELANIMSALCCTELEVERLDESDNWIRTKRNVLPQGAPTSPIVTNIVCQRLDFLLSAVARRFGLRYSRYADDITFSSMHNIYQKESDFLNEINRIIKEQNFAINESKTRLQNRSYRQEVTGLVVNEKVNVHRRYIKQLRTILYLWETYGYDKANDYLTAEYRLSRKKMPPLTSVIIGKLNYLVMIKGSSNNCYLKLKKRLDDLILSEIQKKEMNLANKKLNYPPPEIYSPQKLVRLLNNFTNNGSALKYSTHSWEDGAYENYSQFIQELSKEWKKIEDDIFILRKRLAAKIDSFLDSEKVNENGWGPENPKLRIKYGWKSQELGVWCAENPSKTPFYFPIPKDKIVTVDGITTNYFYNITEIFKRQIEIREENNHLYNLFLNLRKSALGYDFKLEQVNTKGQSFFTDVYAFQSAVIKIFESIRKRPSFPYVKVVCLPKGTNLEIRIIHLNSICNRLVNDQKIVTTDTGDFGTIKSDLFNLCDWSIEAKFKDGKHYRVNYLTSNSTLAKISGISHPVDGFTHILKFYL